MTYPNKSLYPFMAYLTHEEMIQAGTELLDFKQTGKIPTDGVFSKISELILKNENNSSTAGDSLTDQTIEAIEHEIIKRYLDSIMEMKKALEEIKEEVSNG